MQDFKGKWGYNVTLMMQRVDITHDSESAKKMMKARNKNAEKLVVIIT